MIEYAESQGSELRISRAVTPGSGVTFAGTDITSGETVLRRGQILTSRDTGVLAAIGVAAVDVWRKPVVAILSTGDEIIAPGEPMQPAKVYDSNAQVLADAVRELGGEPRRLGIVHDDMSALRSRRATRARICRCRVALRRHQQGRRRCLLSRCRGVARSRNRGARRRPQTRQADLPGGDPRPSGRRAPRLSDVGHLHLSRIRRAGHSPAGRPGPAGERPSCRRAWRSRSTARSAARSTCWSAWSRRRNRAGDGAGGVSDGTRIRKRDDVQPRRRFYDDRPARRDRSGRRRGRRSAARPRFAAGRPRRDWQPLHRPRLPARRAAAARRALEVSRRRQHRRIGRRQARRMRSRGHPPARYEDRRVQSPFPHAERSI